MVYTKIRDIKGDVLTNYNELSRICNNLDNVQNYKLELTKTKRLLDKVNPSLMFYGVYNAGKSSLLNAIFGQVKASVADVPETHKVTYYRWNNFDLVDTPGVNGPEKDFKISKQELQKHDIIMFVIDDSDSFDSMFVANEIVEIIHQKKPLIIVLNNKQYSKTEVIRNIRNKLYENIKIAASNRNLTSVEQKYEFISIDADTAFRGKRENKKLLIEESNINNLEIMISKNLMEINQTKMLINPINFMINLIEEIRLEIKDKTEEIDKNNSVKLLNEISDIKSEVLSNLQISIKSEIRRYNEIMYSSLIAGKEIDTLQSDLSQKISDLLNRELKNFAERCNSSMKVYVENVDLNFNIDAYKGNDLEEIKINKEYPIEDKNEVLDLIEDIPVFTPIPNPTPVPTPIIVYAIKKLIHLFKDDSKQADIDQLRYQIEQKNARQLEEFNNKVNYMQEARTQINIHLYKFEEEVMDLLNENINEIYKIQEQNIGKLVSKNDEELKKLVAIENGIDSIREDLIAVKNNIE